MLTGGVNKSRSPAVTDMQGLEAQPSFLSVEAVNMVYEDNAVSSSS